MERPNEGPLSRNPDVKDLVNRLEGADQEQGGEQEQVAEKPSASVPEADPAAELAKLEGALSAVEKDASAAHDQIDAIRRSLDIPDTGVPSNAEIELISLKEAVAVAEEAVAESAAEVESENPFGAPEGKGQNPQWNEAPPFKPENFANIENEVAEQLKEMREQALKEFIESAVSEVLNGFDDFIDGTENAGQAREVVEQGIRAELLERGEKFIEFGGEQGLGFTASIQRAEFPAPDGEGNKDLMYITDFKMEFNDGPVSFGEGESDENKPEGELLDDDEVVLIQAADEEGVATTTNSQGDR